MAKVPIVLEAQVAFPQQAVTAAYDRAAAIYDGWTWQAFWTRNEVPFVRERLAKVEPRPRWAIDVGTGTGRYLPLLLELGDRAIGVDLSAGMLERARKRVGLRAHLIRADLLKLDLPPRFDCLLGCRVLSHIADLSGALSRLSRLADARATLVLTDLHAEHGYDCTRIEVGGGNLDIPTFKHHPEHIASKLEQLGWRIDHHRDFRYRDLPWRPVDGFRSIDRSSFRPVFYLLVASRAG